MDPDLVRVLAIRHQVDDVSLRDETYRSSGLLIVQDHQSRRARVLQQIRGRGHVVVRFHRRQRWPHNVCDGGRGTWPRGGFRRRGFRHDVLRFRDLSEIP
jgi:hypothetical protein